MTGAELRNALRRFGEVQRRVDAEERRAFALFLVCVLALVLLLVP